MTPLTRISLSIVVPALDEVDRLPVLFDALARVVDHEATEIIVVDDGSADETSAVARSLLARHDLRGTVAALPENRGKGAALRAGVALARGERLVTMDADLATDLDALPPLLDALDHHPVVVGSRVAPGATVVRDAAHRRLLGALMRGVRRTLTPLRISDTQCGFKGYRGAEGRMLFALSEQDRFGHDVELLLLAHRLGLAIAEVPVTWEAVPESRVRVVRDSIGTLLEILRARRRRLADEAVGVVSVTAPASAVAAAVRVTDLVLGDGDRTLVVAPTLGASASSGLVDRLVSTFGRDRVEPTTISGRHLRALIGSSPHR